MKATRDAGSEHAAQAVAVMAATGEEGVSLNSLWDAIRDHLQPLNEDTRELVRARVEAFQRRCAVLGAQAEQGQVEQEHELQAVKTQLEKESSALRDSSQRVTQLEGDLETWKQKCAEAGRKLDSHEAKVESLEKEKRKLEEESKELGMMLERKGNEILRYQQEYKNITEQLIAASTAKCQACLRVEELEYQQREWKHKGKHWEEEKHLLEKQVEQLTKELQEKVEASLDTNREKSTKLLQAQLCLSEKIEELRMSEGTIEALRSKTEKQEKHVEELNETLHNLRASMQDLEDKYRQEVKAQKKLVAIYEEAAVSSEQKCQEMERALGEMQGQLDGEVKARADLEEDLVRAKGELEEEQKKRAAAIATLQRELKDANSLIESLKRRGPSGKGAEILSESAAAAAKVFQSGFSLTQLYSEYISVSEALETSKAENHRLSTYIDQILAEIEERAPSLQKMKEDRDHALETINALSKQLEGAMRDKHEISYRLLEAEKNVRAAEAEKNATLQTLADLKTQVLCLLKEVEKLKGKEISDSLSEGESEVSSTADSQQLISEKLVRFRDLEELQEQNQNLLTTIRDLTSHSEDIEIQAAQRKEKEYQEKLDVLEKELQQLKASRERQELLMENFARQRDMYRQLASHDPSVRSPPSSFSQPDQAIAESTPIRKEGSPSVIKLREMEGALERLKEEYASYRREKEEHERMLNQRIERYEEITATAQMKQVKLESKVEYSEERLKIVKTNLESYKKQITMLEERNKQYSATNAKQEQTILALQDEVLKAKSEVHRLEITNENLRKEKELLKVSEARLTHEKEYLSREARTQGSVMANLEAIKLQLEKAESFSKMQMENQMEDLKNEAARLRTECENVETRRKEAERQLLLARNNEEDQKTQVESLKRQLQEGKNLIAELREELGKLQNCNNLDGQLLKSECESLRSQLEGSRKREEELKKLVAQAEEDLRAAVEHQAELQQRMDAKLKATQEETQNLEKKNAELNKGKEELQVKLKALEDELQRAAASQAALIEESKGKQQEADDALEKERAARESLADQLRMTHEAEDRYEQEVIRHGADMEALKVLRDQLQELQGKAAELEEEKQGLLFKLTEKERTWKEQEESWNGKEQSLQERISVLEEQNMTLLQEVETLSATFTSLRDSSGSGEGLNISITEENLSKSQEQLMEVIKFLRKEKELAKTRLDVVEVESLRLKAQLKVSQNELTTVKVQLLEAQDKTQMGLMSSEEHAELLHKVELMTTLTANNRILREERDAFQTRSKELEARNQELETGLRPLQERVRELDGRIEVLTSENATLKGEVKRWQQRANFLLEKSNQINPEEHRRLTREKEELTGKLQTVLQEKSARDRDVEKLRVDVGQLSALNSTLTDDVKKAQVEVIRLRQQAYNQGEEVKQLQKKLGENETQINQLMTDVKTKDLEITKMKEELEARSVKLNDLQKDITQVKKIARKYRTQAEELQKGQEGMQAELEGVKAQLREKETQLSNQAPAAPDQSLLDQAKEAGRQEATRELEAKVQELSQQVKEMEASHKEEKDNNEKQKEKARQTIENFRNKLKTLTQLRDEIKAQKERVEAELQTLRGASTPDAMGEAMKSQYEGRIVRLEKELTEVKAEKDILQQRLALLQTKSTMAVSGSAGMGPAGVVTAANIRPSVQTPPSATIYPQISSAAVMRVQPIRHAMAGTTVIFTSTQPPTRTATVMPTHLSSTSSIESVGMGELGSAPRVVVQPSVQETPPLARPMRSTATTTPIIREAGGSVFHIGSTELTIREVGENSGMGEGNVALVVPNTSLIGTPAASSSLAAVTSTSSIPSAPAIQIQPVPGPSSGASAISAPVKRKLPESAVDSGQAQLKRAKEERGEAESQRERQEPVEEDDVIVIEDSREADEGGIVIDDSQEEPEGEERRDEEEIEEENPEYDGVEEEEKDNDEGVEEDDEETEREALDEEEEVEDEDEELDEEEEISDEEEDDEGEKQGMSTADEEEEDDDVTVIEEPTAEGATDDGGDGDGDAGDVDGGQEGEEEGQERIRMAVGDGGAQSVSAATDMGPGPGGDTSMLSLPVGRPGLSSTSGFEEAGDEGIVPSTPTLYPARFPGEVTVVSSPGDRFIFSTPTQPGIGAPSHLESEDAQMMDATRVDLSQMGEARGDIIVGQHVSMSHIPEGPGDSNQSGGQEVPESTQEEMEPEAGEGGNEGDTGEMQEGDGSSQSQLEMPSSSGRSYARLALALPFVGEN
ncbi:unnamed protein product [Darwinula stevensoni]|uniref:Nucleoprotein TPR n=1 Tax=Darwinula stevensoni TaxID=69355 RepID=A0A7R9AAU7_9CRUS|nr:unnamed protein product [Darwinula stevensoni]CAG0898479.1 unnamed protein product [Darwinula stevensoni]